MEFKQDTFGDILISERDMVLTGAEQYGDYFINAAEFNDLFNTFVKSADDVGKFIFFAFLSQVRKHHTLALFSAVRLHHIQAGLNLRQVFEAGAWAAYAMAYEDEDKFCKKDEFGLLEVPKSLKKARDQWLENNFKIQSDKIKKLKNGINESVAHSNIIYAFQNFSMKPIEDPGFNTPFFDFEDNYKVKSDLWFIANTALGFIDLFYSINLKYKVFKLVDDFDQRFRNLIAVNDKLKAEAMSSQRYLDAKKNI